jgi:hypothetical protein
MTTPTKDELRAARDAYLKAQRRASRCSRALYKLNELHRDAGAAHARAKAAYDQLRDRFVDAILEDDA